jgi:hypothetical protein
MRVFFQARQPQIDVLKPRVTTRSLKHLEGPPELRTDQVHFSGTHHAKLLLPEGTPVFLMHGTSADGDKIGGPILRMLREDMSGQQLRYVAYLREVEEGSGIETVKNEKTTLPAAVAVLRDLGDFRYQVLNQRLKAWNRCVEEADGNLDAAIMRFFSIPPQMAGVLSPVIQKYILEPLSSVPSGWPGAYRIPLNTLVGNVLGKLQREMSKLNLTGPEAALPIHDTQFLYDRAVADGFKLISPKDQKELLLRRGKDTFKLRVISLEDVARLEGYLFNMETALAKALVPIVKAQLQTGGSGLLLQSNKTAAGGMQGASEVAVKAERMAASLMDTLAPRSLAVGHSQGGTVLTTALINMAMQLDQLKQKENQLGAFDLTEMSVLAARGMGFVSLLSGVTSGLTDEPAWGKKVMRELDEVQAHIPVLRKKEGLLGNGLKSMIWHHREKDPAIAEMRANSVLMQKISNNIYRVEDKMLTTLSSSDLHDGYVEPGASQLRDPDGKSPSIF